MNSPSPTPTTGALAVNGRLRTASIPELVAEVYESATAVQRARLLEQLLRHVGVISLFGIAGGVFANIRFRSGWQDVQVRPEDIQSVTGTQVVALVNHVQQISAGAVGGLTQMLIASPLLSSSAAAAVLLTMLVQHASKPGASRTLSA